MEEKNENQEYEHEFKRDKMLLCTFATDQNFNSSLNYIKRTFNPKAITIYKVDDDEADMDKLLLLYTVDKSVDFKNMIKGTIRIHKKKRTNTLFTINALNTLIAKDNNGVVDLNYEIDWSKYTNKIILYNQNEEKLNIDNLIFINKLYFGNK